MSSELASLIGSLAYDPETLLELSSEQLQETLYHWPAWARSEQLPPPGDWRTWLILAGRGWGKTRTGAEYIRSLAESERGLRFALVGRTAADVRDTMVEGESGILATARPDFKPQYEPSKRRITWPDGTMATCFAADEPNQLRGPQHHHGWADETAAWRYPETWDNLQLGLRLGNHPTCVVTTTPRPTSLIRSIAKNPSSIVKGGSTYDNAENLAQGFLDELRARYEHTRLGRQELFAEILDDAPGALWSRKWFDEAAFRVRSAPVLRRIVIAIDPATTSRPDSDETGITVQGVFGVGNQAHGYLLEDLSGIYSPLDWARVAVNAYRSYKANKIIAETNQGGEMVEATIKSVDSGVHVESVHHFRGKDVRAEPVAALYEQRRIHHVGSFGKLEDQLCQWTPVSGEDSPDRMDATVIGFTELMLGAQAGRSPVTGGFRVPESKARM
jgi:phage terminase large subunit-like protein